MSNDNFDFDAIVIGSGFGGSVTAYRLAQEGLSVCVLERGKAYPPGEFPRSPHRMKKNFWDPSEGLHGMYNVWSFDRLGAVVCSGLGGGSLIYANVLIRKDRNWFVRREPDAGGELWPISYDDLEPHYERAEEMLGAQRYPFGKEPYDATPKTREFEAAAGRLGLDWELPNLAVTFANKDEEPVPGEPIREARKNLHGRTRQTCRLVGECDLGCNYGSKNTLDHNYLSEAKEMGADIRTLCEVRRFEPRSNGAGYIVRYVRHRPDPGREGRHKDTSALPEHTLHARQLILSAGALGSTFLLLKNRDAFPGLSPMLGTRFCGNGDIVTFALKGRKNRDEPRLIDAGYGPVITGRIRVDDERDGGDGRGYYIQDAGYPEFVNWMLEVVDAPADARRAFWGGIFGRLRDKLLSRQPETDVGAEAARLLGSTELSGGLLPMLGMGRDVPDGRMELVGDAPDEKLNVDWRVENSEAYFRRVRETMRDVAEELGARYSDPLGVLNRLVTVHPLGGCPMGSSREEGVVDPRGRVFKDQEFYEGFYIADGSVMPGPVGPNPSLTIAAVADRFADGMIQDSRAWGDVARKENTNDLR